MCVQIGIILPLTHIYGYADTARKTPDSGRKLLIVSGIAPSFIIIQEPMVNAEEASETIKYTQGTQQSHDYRTAACV